MKKILKRSIPLVLLLIVLFSVKFNTTIYLAFEAGRDPTYVDNVTVKIDNTIIYDNVTLQPAWSNINVMGKKRPMRMGFHKIEASTKNGEIILKKKVFILLSRYIMIQYWETANIFTARTGFMPYLFM